MNRNRRLLCKWHTESIDICRKSILYLLTQLMPDMLKLEEMGSNE